MVSTARTTVRDWSNGESPLSSRWTTTALPASGKPKSSTERSSVAMAGVSSGSRPRKLLSP